MDNFNNLVSGVPQAVDLVNDGWTDIIGKLLLGMQQGKSTDFTPDGIAKAVELADFEKMEEIRARVDAEVKDAQTAEALKPFYRQFCKRPCFHNEYLATFNRPNVTLVDTRGRGVDRITRKGVVVDGREYELDCLIYASGFEVGTDYCRRAGLEIHGRGGRALDAYWAPGTRTLHGMHVHGFPNCFLMSNVQAGFTANFPHLLNEQAKHLAYIVRRGREESAASIEVTAEAEQEWIDHCIEKARQVGDFFENCTPGYYNNEGKPGERSAQDGFYGGGSPAFFGILEAWRAQGTMPGLVVTRDRV
jgi:cyclohexanone monooxygenase